MKTIRELADKKGKLPEFDKKLQDAFLPLTMNSEQDEFDKFRKQLEMLYNNLQAKRKP